MISYAPLVKIIEEREISKYTLRKEKVAGAAILEKIFAEDGLSGQGVDVRVIDRFCKFLDLQPGDLIECVPDPEGYSDQAKKWGADKKF